MKEHVHCVDTLNMKLEIKNYENTNFIDYFNTICIK